MCGHHPAHNLIYFCLMTALDSFIASVSFIFQRKKPQDQDVLSDWAVEAKHGMGMLEEPGLGAVKLTWRYLATVRKAKINW